MQGLSITPATPADVPVVQRLARIIWQRHYPGIIRGEQIEYMLDRGYSTEALSRFIDEAGAGMALARVVGEPAGFACWYRSDEPATIKLDKLYVLQQHQGRGLGRALIAHVEAVARAGGAATLILNVNKDNAGSIAAYRKCGFAVRESVVVDIGNGFVMDDYVMAKPL